MCVCVWMCSSMHHVQSYHVSLFREVAGGSLKCLQKNRVIAVVCVSAGNLHEVAYLPDRAGAATNGVVADGGSTSDFTDEDRFVVVRRGGKRWPPVQTFRA